MTVHEEYQYLELCKKVLNEGTYKGDRTGTGTYSIFGHQMRFDLSKGFPLLTTKHVPLRIVAEELFWFLQGETNIQPLVQKNVHIWDEWPFEKWATSEAYDGELDMTNWQEKARKDKEFAEAVKKEQNRFIERIANDDEFAAIWGELGSVYGKQWRSWTSHRGDPIDQISDVIEQIKNNPNSRRLIVNAWKVDEVGEMALPPCHTMFQFYVADGKLSCQLYQRSADIFLGVPFNIASYSLLTMMVAQVTGLEVGEFVHTFGDAHIYSNHIEQVNLQLTREPYEFPKVVLNKYIDNIFDFTWDDIELIDYKRHPRIKAPVAV